MQPAEHGQPYVAIYHENNERPCVAHSSCTLSCATLASTAAMMRRSTRARLHTALSYGTPCPIYRARRRSTEEPRPGLRPRGATATSPRRWGTPATSDRTMHSRPAVLSTQPVEKRHANATSMHERIGPTSTQLVESRNSPLLLAPPNIQVVRS